MDHLEKLVADLQAALGENLKSVMLYGSAVAGDFVPGISGHDILIVVEQLGARELTALATPLRNWQNAGNPLPQVFTAQELTNSADVFPIEFLDMQQSRKVLFGADLLADLKIDQQLYRVQLERELKTRLQLLRRGYLRSTGNEEEVARLMVASVSTFLVLLRAALRLYNDPAPAEKADALAQLAKHVSFDPRPLQSVLEMKKSKRLTAAEGIEPLFNKYLASIEHVVRAVDRHLHPTSETK